MKDKPLLCLSYKYSKVLWTDNPINRVRCGTLGNIDCPTLCMYYRKFIEKISLLDRIGVRKSPSLNVEKAVKDAIDKLELK